MRSIVNISESVHGRLKSYCSRNGLKIGVYVEKLIDAGIADGEPAKPKKKTKK